MIGARDAFHSNEGRMLTFRVGSNAKKVTTISVGLDADDTYTMRFYRGRGIHTRLVSEDSGVYADMLRPMIEAHTGLCTSL